MPVILPVLFNQTAFADVDNTHKKTNVTNLFIIISYSLLTPKFAIHCEATSNESATFSGYAIAGGTLKLILCVFYFSYFFTAKI